jgi:hypothetical protein
MLTNRFQNILVSRSSSVPFGNKVTNTFAIKGFIQPVSGSENFQAGKSGEKVGALLFSEMGYNAVYGDSINYNGITYKVLYGTQPNGISGTGHHKEMTLEVLI